MSFSPFSPAPPLHHRSSSQPPAPTSSSDSHLPTLLPSFLPLLTNASTLSSIQPHVTPPQQPQSKLELARLANALRIGLEQAKEEVEGLKGAGMSEVEQRALEKALEERLMRRKVAGEGVEGR